MELEVIRGTGQGIGATHTTNAFMILQQARAFASVGMPMWPPNNFANLLPGSALVRHFSGDTLKVRDLLAPYVANQLGITVDQVLANEQGTMSQVNVTWDQQSSLEAFGDMIAEAAARFNPVLAAGRAAMLALVKMNYRRLATKMKANNPSRVRSKWENWGGQWANLESAINEGATKAPVGRVGLAAAAAAPAASATWSTFLAAAKPLIEPILQLLGINLDEPTEEEEKIEEGANTSGNQDVTDEVNAEANPNGWVMPVVVVGGAIAAAVLLSPKPRRKKSRR